MRTDFFISLTAISFFLLLANAEKNPCHNNKDAQGSEVTCEKVVVPRWLCSNCPLKPPSSSGDFKNCRSIYDIQAPKCKYYLKLYAKLNKQCDPVRYRQTRDFNNSANIEGLDYFVYSVCEQCCDCVPRSSKLSEYKNRQMNNNLMDPKRGNCVAHAYYDICKVLPKIKYVVDPQNKFPFTAPFKPYVCPLFTKWMARPENKNWVLTDGHYIDPPIARFFNNFFKVVNCGARKVWGSCVNLEGKQGRL